MTQYSDKLKDSIQFFHDDATGEKCLAIKVTGGEAIDKGMVVCALIGGTSGKFTKVPISGVSHSMPVGVALTACSGDGQTFWMAICGLVQVKPDAAITAAMGNVIVSSDTTAGLVQQYSTVPAADHWDEIGHFTETGSGNGALALAIVHFN